MFGLVSCKDAQLSGTPTHTLAICQAPGECAFVNQLVKEISVQITSGNQSIKPRLSRALVNLLRLSITCGL